MYRCENCKTVVPPNQKLNRVVTETREKSYAIFRKAQKGRGRRPFDGPPEPVRHANGFEIVKEARVCSACAGELSSKVVETAAAAAPEAGIGAPVIIA